MYKRIVIPNNLRILSIPMKETKAVTLYFLIGAGSRYEDESINGISHFLEHLFFKGTKKRPSAFELTEELDGIGANYNAFTADEMTGFYIQAAASQFERIADVLFDILSNSLFAKKEIERERGVILQEINMRKDVPQAHVHDLYKQLLYGNTPLGRLTIGTPEAIKKLNRQDFLQYEGDFYSGSSSVLAVAGKLTPKILFKLKEYGKKIKKGTKNKYEPFIEKQIKPEVLVYPKKTDQAHLILGYKSIPHAHPLRYAQEILNIILGASMSSRLFTELREKRGLCYYVYSQTWYFYETGSLLSAAGVPINKAKGAVKIILNELFKIKEKGVTPAELKKAKEYYKGKAALAMESSYRRASFYADQELLLGKIETEKERIRKMEEVNEKDVMKLAERMIRPERLNLALIGPFDKKEEFEKILS